MKKLILIASVFLFSVTVVAQVEEIQELVPFPLNPDFLAVKTTIYDSTTQVYTVQYSNPKDSAALQLEMFQQIESRKTEIAQYKALTYQASKGIGRLTKIANQISDATYNNYIKEKLKPVLAGDYVLTIDKERIQTTVNNNLRIVEKTGEKRRWTITPDSPYLLSISPTTSRNKYELVKTSQAPEIWRTLEGDKVVLRKK